MQKPLTKDQILSILETEPASKTATSDDLYRLVRRVEWEHKIGDDPHGFTSQKIVRMKDIELHRKLEDRMPNQKKWTGDKLEKLLEAVGSGEKPAEIADRLGLTRQRVYELIRKAERDRKNPTGGHASQLDGLSARARNAVIAFAKDDSLDAAYSAITSKNKVQGMGAGTKYEIQQFLLDKKYKPSKSVPT